MDITALLLSRIQFAFTISFHIIFPAFSIGLAAWLTVLEALHLKTGRPAYRLLFEFWLKIFGVAFGLGVVSGVVMAFQFGTNWSVLSKMSGPIQGPLLSYETFTAFALAWLWPIFNELIGCVGRGTSDHSPRFHERSRA
jgi:cytochrome bd ubiquinol oxidase subunit I